MTNYNNDLFTINRLLKLNQVINRMKTERYYKVTEKHGKLESPIMSPEFKTALDEYQVVGDIKERKEKAFSFLALCEHEANRVYSNSSQLIFYNGDFMNLQKIRTEFKIELMNIIDSFKDPFVVDLSSKRVGLLYKKVKKLGKILEIPTDDALDKFILSNHERFDVDRKHAEYFINNKTFMVKQLYTLSKIIKSLMNNTYLSYRISHDDLAELSAGGKVESPPVILKTGELFMESIKEIIDHVEQLEIIITQTQKNVSRRVRGIINAFNDEYNVGISYTLTVDGYIEKMLAEGSIKSCVKQINKILFDIKPEPSRKKELEDTDPNKPTNGFEDLVADMVYFMPEAEKADIVNDTATSFKEFKEAKKGDSLDFLEEYLRQKHGAKQKREQEEQEKIANQLPLGSGYDVDGHKFYIWHYKKEDAFVMDSHSLAPDFELKLSKEAATKLRDKLNHYLEGDTEDEG